MFNYELSQIFNFELNQIIDSNIRMPKFNNNLQLHAIKNQHGFGLTP